MDEEVTHSASNPLTPNAEAAIFKELYVVDQQTSEMEHIETEYQALQSQDSILLATIEEPSGRSGNKMSPQKEKVHEKWSSVEAKKTKASE